ncbi:unnamed protein product [Owenia fusiformis]|uniref:Uncharacterized protein n=1 Tax=Owenia fusiformis TaxID=6347 RepID=A0A8J1U9T3_OWEFU|nr:unnamed protein product [Owenia fusiformis]
MALSKILDFMKCSDGMEDYDSVICDNCETNPAIKRCSNCTSTFCEKCKQAHDKMKVNKTHKWIEVDEIPNNVAPIQSNPAFEPEEVKKKDPKLNCDKHKDHTIKYFCVDDEEAICEACCNTDHSLHKKITIEEQSLTAKKMADELNNSGKARIKALDKSICNLKQHKAEVQNEQFKVNSTLKDDNPVDIVRLIPHMEELLEEWADNSAIVKAGCFGVYDYVQVIPNENDNTGELYMDMKKGMKYVKMSKPSSKRHLKPDGTSAKEQTKTNEDIKVCDESGHEPQLYANVSIPTSPPSKDTKDDEQVMKTPKPTPRESPNKPQNQQDDPVPLDKEVSDGVRECEAN